VTKKEYIIGDIFRVMDYAMQMEKYVVLTRAIADSEHFFLASIKSFEPWSERVISAKNIYEKTSLSDDEIQYLANTSRVAHVGNISEFKDDLRKMLLEKEEQNNRQSA